MACERSSQNCVHRSVRWRNRVSNTGVSECEKLVTWRTNAHAIDAWRKASLLTYEQATTVQCSTAPSPQRFQAPKNAYSRNRHQRRLSQMCRCLSEFKEQATVLVQTEKKISHAEDNAPMRANRSDRVLVITRTAPRTAPSHASPHFALPASFKTTSLAPISAFVQSTPSFPRPLSHLNEFTPTFHPPVTF